MVEMVELASFFFVPLVAGIALGRWFGWILVAGLAPTAVEWFLAYRANNVLDGGDWQPGTELAFFTGLVAFIGFFGLWALGTAVGAAFSRGRRRPQLRRRSAGPSALARPSRHR